MGKQTLFIIICATNPMHQSVEYKLKILFAPAGSKIYKGEKRQINGSFEGNSPVYITGVGNIGAGKLSNLLFGLKFAFILPYAVLIFEHNQSFCIATGSHNLIVNKIGKSLEREIRMITKLLSFSPTTCRINATVKHFSKERKQLDYRCGRRGFGSSFHLPTWTAYSVYLRFLAHILDSF